MQNYTLKPGMPNIRLLQKLLLIMKLTTFILMITMLHVSAASFAQKISLNETNSPIEKVFKSIRQQSGYEFIYNVKDLKNQKISIKLNDVSVDDAVKELIKDLPLSYKIIKNNIVLTKIEPSLADAALNLIRIVFQDRIEVRGKILDEKGNPLPGATVKVKGTGITTVTNEQGDFMLNGIDKNAILIINYIGYEPMEMMAIENIGTIKLALSIGKLNEVVVSTGYQTLPKERATGSFVLIDSALIDRKVSANILGRLDGVTSGVLFNKNKIANTPDISIRGRSTVQGNPNPLIVLDNFPYDGDLNNINPQDIASISILKDAAAASIWGTRAGNGVIVITTRKGKFNQKPQVSFNSNVTIGTKPDQYYLPQLSNKEYIDVEQFLFDNGRYNSAITNKYGALSPAVQIMLQRRNNQISDARRSALLDSIAGHDNRSDLNKYFYRNSVTQQHQFSVTGGGEFNKYYVSVGYDKNLSSTVGQSNDRVTLNANNTSRLLNSRLELQTGIILTLANNKSDFNGYVPRYPYERVADNNGNPLAVTDGVLRLPYVDTAGAGRLLDWHYRPLDELHNKSQSTQNKLTDYRLNTGLIWHLLKGLDLSGYYTFQKGTTEINTDAGLNSYYTRNLINTYSQINQTTGAVTWPIPLGDIVNNTNSSYYSHYGRGQVSYNSNFSEKNKIDAIAGYEIKDYRIDYASTMLYDPTTATNLNSAVNYTALNKYYYRSTTAKIPTGISNSWGVDRYRSYFANASYTYDRRYVLSASARKDESNLFGVNSNQKGVPLWSAGLAWNISDEKFYNVSAIPYLRFRFTYGYNGNVDKSTSAYLTAVTNATLNIWNNPYLNIQNPPNPSLEWEKVENINWGLDFGLKNNRISGSVEFWLKNGNNLIGRSPIAAQSGVDVFTGNTANTNAKGIDVQLNTKNLTGRVVNWSTAFLFNCNTDKITQYKAKAVSNNSIVNSNYITPLEGYSYYALFAFKYKGLDNTGNPIGVLNNNSSQDYNAIISALNPNDLVYKGTITPKIFGSIRNTFSWKAVEFSMNITYKFNYYFRRNSLTSAAIYSLTPVYQAADYDQRWQKAGDELTTNVPAPLYPINSSRDIVYSGSEVLIEKADHIRLQDMRLAYTISRNKNPGSPFSSVQFYGYASNLGILWKATKYKIDPDNPNGIPASKYFSLGVKADF